MNKGTGMELVASHNLSIDQVIAIAGVAGTFAAVFVALMLAAKDMIIAARNHKRFVAGTKNGLFNEVAERARRLELYFRATTDSPPKQVLRHPISGKPLAFEDHGQFYKALGPRTTDLPIELVNAVVQLEMRLKSALSGAEAQHILWDQSLSLRPLETNIRTQDILHQKLIIQVSWAFTVCADYLHHIYHEGNNADFKQRCDALNKAGLDAPERLLEPWEENRADFIG